MQEDLIGFLYSDINYFNIYLKSRSLMFEVRIQQLTKISDIFAYFTQHLSIIMRNHDPLKSAGARGRGFIATDRDYSNIFTSGKTKKVVLFLLFSTCLFGLLGLYLTGLKSLSFLLFFIILSITLLGWILARMSDG